MLFGSFVRNLSFHTGWEESSSHEEAPGWERVPALAAAAHRELQGWAEARAGGSGSSWNTRGGSSCCGFSGLSLPKGTDGSPFVGTLPQSTASALIELLTVIQTDSEEATLQQWFRIQLVPSFLPQENQASLNSSSSYIGHLTSEFNLIKNAFGYRIWVENR